MIKPSDIFSNAAFRGADELVAVMNGHQSPDQCRHARIISSTDARQRLPDHLQDTYGNGTVTVAARYDRPLGAIVPMIAVHYLAVSDALAEAMQGDDPTKVVQALLDIKKAGGEDAKSAAVLLRDVRHDVAQKMGDDFMRAYGFAPA